MEDQGAVDPTALIVIVTLPSGFKHSHYDVSNIRFDGTGGFSFRDAAGQPHFFLAGEHRGIDTMEVHR